MGDDKTFTSPEARASGSDDPDIRHLAERYGITLEQARDLRDRCGDDQPLLEREVQELKGGRHA
ncbi:DUF3606 domain-containing protein [Chelativorans sp. AA-79]|uniref:DUF3606 domain-containing protein n=1 Tax=Chelativorans sp. AA-79 TaxID=3028735 RepID=UPI0023F8B324|nr:DUF3606 domain-containing protein [Chelativorans sp. AA-79]WEX11105.1 DUF3606 domain-containing protein [Chelativorans sp. AA-79]